MAGSTAATLGGDRRAAAATSAAKARALVGVGQVALEQQEPHVLERPLLGQVDGRVLAVVVEALLAADVADLGVGDDDALQAPGTSTRGTAAAGRSAAVGSVPASGSVRGSASVARRGGGRLRPRRWSSSCHDSTMPSLRPIVNVDYAQR